MRIALRQPYKSIQALEAEDLSSFCVLIGRNGAGKTQLLAALKEGSAVIQNIDLADVALYDMNSFCTDNASFADRTPNRLAELTVARYLVAPPGEQALAEKAKRIFNRCAQEIERKSGETQRAAFATTLRQEIRDSAPFSVFPADGDRSSPYNKALYEEIIVHLEPPMVKKRRRTQTPRGFKGSPASLLSAAMRLTGKLPHEVTRGDIMRVSHGEGNALTNSISKVFATYKLDEFVWAHARMETGTTVPFADLIAEYRRENRPPWDVLREVLTDMRDAAGDDGLFDFDFADPDGQTLNMANYERFSFRAQMTNLTTGAMYEIDSLSSGETILMALCLASFNHYLGRRKPKLLLLDELDAVLHPSMVAALVKTLQSLFVAHGTKVVLTSHSPMTIAAMPEIDIFRVAREGGLVTISRTSKSDAISELSEGLATVDVGLRIATSNNAPVTILTEGRNTCHIQKWVDMTFRKEVYVFDEMPVQTSSGELRAYGRLLGRMNTNTHFVIVWDCDAGNEAERLRSELPSDAKVTAFAFKRREDNRIARRGIENAYDERMLEAFAITKSRHDGTVLCREFHKDRKTEFAKHIQEHATSADFTHYGDLHAVISAVLVAQRQDPHVSGG